MQNIFPIIISVLFFSASAVYAYTGEYGKALYFFASMITGVSAAFLIK